MKHGIFCLENPWYPRQLDRRLSVRPILEVLSDRERIPFVHRECGTAADIHFYLEQWTLKRYRRYPILYLAFHGEPKLIWIGNDKFTLDQFAELFEGRCERKVVVLGSCATLHTDRRHLKRFLKMTKALAVCGYLESVDWVPSTAFEMMLLFTLVKGSLGPAGLEDIKARTERIARAFKELPYRMVLRG